MKQARPAVVAALTKRLLAATIVLASPAACSAQWSLPLGKLDRVALSVAQPASDAAFVVGGPLGSAGQALFFRYDGAAWHAVSVASAATLWWVFARSAGDVYTVGEQGSAYHWDGARLAMLTLPTTKTLFGVWGVADDDLWIVGGTPDVDGVILHRDAAGWRDLTPAGTSGAYFKVWGASSSDVFICGQGASILHWDGKALTAEPLPLPASTSLFTVAGRSGSDVYAVGGLGSAAAVHFDGKSWSRVSDAALANAPGLAGVAVDSDGSVVFVGAEGTKLRGRPGALVDDTMLATRADLHAASLRDGEIFTVGGNYLAPAPAARSGVVAHFGGGVAGMIE